MSRKLQCAERTGNWIGGTLLQKQCEVCERHERCEHWKQYGRQGELACHMGQTPADHSREVLAKDPRPFLFPIEFSLESLEECFRQHPGTIFDDV